ncbi:hypothetical protein ACFL20_01195 [Spirochaetota bacterium]
MFKFILTVFIISIFFLSHNVKTSADEACNDYEPGYTDNLPNATSFLYDKKDPLRYSPQKAFDKKISTSWVEGKKGDGIGEKIAFPVKTLKKIKIFPGYGDKKYFKKNNRVKKASLKIYEIKRVIHHQCASSFELGKLIKNKVLNFEDKMAYQSFDIGVTKQRSAGYAVIIEILSVYRGTNWRDTCIAEIGTIE